MIFWIVVGIAGVAGGLAGELVTHFGLTKALKWATLAIAASIALLTIASDGILMLTLSAVLFGATFILITALYGIWSVSCFPEAPSTGFGLTFFLISARSTDIAHPCRAWCRDLAIDSGVSGHRDTLFRYLVATPDPGRMEYVTNSLIPLPQHPVFSTGCCFDSVR